MTPASIASVRRIAVVEDHLLQRNRTVELLTHRPDLRVVFSGETMPEFIDWMRSAPVGERPALIVLDLMVERRPSVDPDIVASLAADGIKVLVLSALASPPLVRRMIESGVSGVVGKRDSEHDILAAIDAVLDEGEWMTPELANIIAAGPRSPTLSAQEERALVLYATGLTLDAVAVAIGVKRDTAKQYLDRVKAKYIADGQAVSTKLDLHRVAMRDGYIDDIA